MRAMKAEGGWAVVSNQETEIHPTSDLSPYAEGRLWDERDIPALRLMTGAVHDKGALAAVELVHNGPFALNHLSRVPGAGTIRDVGGRRLSPPCPRDGQVRHPRLAPLAPRCRAARPRCGIRHRLCLCRPRAVDHTAIHAAASEHAQRRIRWQPRKPRAPDPGTAGRHARSRGRYLRRGLPLCGG